MPSFARQVADLKPTRADLKNRRWIFVPYDRFTDRTGPLTEQPAADTGIVIVESTAKALRRPYHKKKLVLLISNMRHFALEQAARGVSVFYHLTPGSHGQGLLELQGKHHLRLTTTIPAERELRLDLATAIAAGLEIKQVQDTHWLSQTEDFLAVYGPWRADRTSALVMDRFYRHMRQKTGILMEKKKPVGGQFSFDPDNRNPYRGEVPVPVPPTFAPDALTTEVIDYVSTQYAHHFGSIANFGLACTQADADLAWQFSLRQHLPHFGPFEDAMRDDHGQLFHSKTSAHLNLGRMLPLTLVQDVAAAAAEGTIPLASAEGFIRQLLGWREFMRHLHEQTDGYRLLDVARQQPVRPQELSPDLAQHPGLVAASYPTASLPSPAPEPEANPLAPADPYAGATPSALNANLPLPAAYWGVKSGLHCLDTCAGQVVEDGWTHHIPRLMVLANLANLCGFSPRELTDWFWFGYIDAYDWVVEPNVLGMATFGDGGLTATKPYVSGAAYINRMSNFCGHCQYDPKKTLTDDACPFTALYWTFLERNRDRLASIFRMRMPLNTLSKKPESELVQLRARAKAAVDHLASFERPTY